MEGWLCFCGQVDLSSWTSGVLGLEYTIESNPEKIIKGTVVRSLYDSSKEKETELSVDEITRVLFPEEESSI